MYVLVYKADFFEPPNKEQSLSEEQTIQAILGRVGGARELLLDVSQG